MNKCIQNDNACDMYIVSTETLIARFMEDFRSSFPDRSIPVKMHMLEEHTVPWARKTHVGFGLLAEQGAESIHARFNDLQRTYHSVPDNVRRLVLIVYSPWLHKMWQQFLHLQSKASNDLIAFVT